MVREEGGVLVAFSVRERRRPSMVDEGFAESRLYSAFR